MTLAANFLAGAQSRLLPASVPFRFFGAAVVSHVLMWLIAMVNAADVMRFRGGLGPGLAAVHLLTVGVFAMTAIGAGVQLLPVATRRALRAVWPIKLVFWTVLAALVVMLAGMYALQTALLIGGAAAATIGLLLFAVLLADNLRRADRLGVVGAYGWTSVVSLIALVLLGLLLALDYRRVLSHDHAAVARAHLILGGFGFMGMLAIGFSHILIPMFALASIPAKAVPRGTAILAIAALGFGSIGALVDSRELLTVAAVGGLAAAVVHVWTMLQVLKAGMRKRLGLSFLLIRSAWALLPTTLVVGLLTLYDYAGPNGATLFGFLLLGGWLLTFLLGILQRIVPFLASMHATRSAGRIPMSPSELACAGTLKLHAVCHGLAIAGVAAAMALDNDLVMQIACAVGLVGAAGFAAFLIGVTKTLIASRIEST
jgi:hypothetical protein